MDEGFDLNAFSRGGPEVGERKLAGRHGADHAAVRGEARSGRIGDRHLGAGVPRQFRRDEAGQTQNAEVLHDDGVHAGVAQKSQVIRQLAHLPIVRERVHRHKQARAVQMRKTHGAAQLVAVEIVGVSARAEGLAAQIHGVGPGVHRRFKGFPRSGGRQQFKEFFHDLLAEFSSRRSPRAADVFRPRFGRQRRRPDGMAPLSLYCTPFHWKVNSRRRRAEIFFVRAGRFMIN